MNIQNSLFEHPNYIAHIDNLYIFDIPKESSEFPKNNDENCLHSIISHTANCFGLVCSNCLLYTTKTKLEACTGPKVTKFVLNKYFPKLKDTNPELFI